MPYRDAPEPMLPGTYVLRDADIERVALAVAQTTAKAMREDTPTKDDMEEIADKAIERFCEGRDR